MASSRDATNERAERASLTMKIERVREVAAASLHDIAACFVDGARITLIVRAVPGNGETDFILTDDDVPQAIDALRRRAVAEGESLPSETAPPMLDELCKAFGWQGGTIHQALAEARRLKEIEHTAYHFLEMSEERISDKEVAVELPNEDYDKLCVLLGDAHPEMPARTETGAIPDEFRQLAEFYDVKDMAALVRIQEERIEDMRQQLPKPRGPETDPHNYRRG